MKKRRDIYKLELCENDCVIVYRKDRNIGRIAFIYIDSWRHSDKASYPVPNYILKEAREMINKAEKC